MFEGYRKVLVVGGAAVLLMASALGTRALADATTQTTTATTTTTTTAENTTVARTATASKTTGPKAKYGPVFLDKLAAALGIDTEKLQEAMKQAASDTVDEAVKNGDLTQPQADRLKSRIQQDGNLFGGLGGLGRGHFGHGPSPAMGHGEMAEAIADRLGMSVQDLRTELRLGKSLSDIAMEKRVSEQDLRAAVVNAVKPQLDAAVKDGKLTQQQADRIIQQIDQGQWPMFTGKGQGKGQRTPQAPSQTPVQPQS